MPSPQKQDSDETKKETEQGDAEKNDDKADDSKEGEDGKDKELVYLCQRWIGIADAETDELNNAEADTTLFLSQGKK